MISITSGEVITFAQACDLLPRDPVGRKITTITLRRWARRGANGTVLDSAKLGRTWYTTRSALDEFTTAQARHESPIKAKAGDLARAEAECRQLEAMGL